MKKEFKKIAAVTAALVLTCGCMLSGLRRDPALSFAEGDSTEKTEKVTGDINGDGAVNSSDLLKLLQYMYGTGDLSEVEKAGADMNSDEKTDVADFVLLKNKIVDPEVLTPGDLYYGALAAPYLKDFRRVNAIDATDYMNFVASSAATVLLDTKDENNSGNPVYSPMSYYMALSMTAECAEGDTRDQIVKALGSENIEDLRKVNNDVFSFVYFEDESDYCVLSNSLWLNNKWKFKQDTLDLIADNYYAASFAKNFGDKEQTENEISDWIFKATKEMIAPKIKIEDPELDIMKIYNTVAFKGAWRKGFSKSEQDVFHKRDGGEEKCEFLKEQDTTNVGFGENFKVYGKLYDCSYTMYFILPDEGTDINDIISDPDTLAAIFTGDLDYQYYCDVNFAVPQYEVSSKFDLTEAAQKLGISDAFSGKADFSGVSDASDGIRISTIDQEAVLKVDREGAKAAAYTGVEIKASASPGPSEIILDFKLDRPFFYYVARGQEPIFAGVMENPNETSK